MGTATRHLIVPTPEESRLAAETLKSLSSKGFQISAFSTSFSNEPGIVAQRAFAAVLREALD